MTVVPAYAVAMAGFAAPVVESGGSLPEIVTSAGIGALALSVGWLLLRRSDNREREMTDAARKALAEERAAHDLTRAALLDTLRATRDEMR